MYKVNFTTASGQKGAVYIVARSDEDAVAKVKAYFKTVKEKIEIGLISFQFEGQPDMFIEIENDELTSR